MTHRLTNWLQAFPESVMPIAWRKKIGFSKEDIDNYLADSQ